MDSYRSYRSSNKPGSSTSTHTASKKVKEGDDISNLIDPITGMVNFTEDPKPKVSKNPN
jgi:hypothetical protein